MSTSRLSIAARLRFERARADRRPIEQRAAEIREKSAQRLAVLFAAPGKAPSAADISRMRVRLAAMSLSRMLERAARGRVA